MASINRLIPSVASGSLELAPALANLNFDFALWKVAAPKEFEGVGSALSAFRRDDAETGTLHTIARKLGALFEKKVPWTPALTKAYGTRASEIAQALSLDERGRKSYGVFANRAGADATSLWAAATSGTSAISIHLLACLLARIWDAPEATSIWVEIIKRRKEEVLADFNETDFAHLATLSAARQDLPRAQIAEWDNSARAWLQVADSVKKKQQTQLMLILDNVQVPVNGKNDTYDSVMEAWCNSLDQMEALVQGVSQQARNGDILLALSSWHLFPDLTVVTPSMTHIRQNDPVFGSGGVLTIGLQGPVVQYKGVHWSLPLAYLRHYGAPVVAGRSICSGSRSRLSLQELLQATLGSLLQGWGTAGKDTLRSLRWLSSMYQVLLEGTKLGYDKSSTLTKGSAKHSWLALLSEAAYLYTISHGVERQHNDKLISLGRKHGKTFLGTPGEPVFGLLAQGKFIDMMAEEEERIELLRKVGEHLAERLCLGSSQIFIRYKHHLSDSTWVYEYATAIPYNTSKKRRADGTLISVQSHHRWLYSGSHTRRRFSSISYKRRSDMLPADIDERYASTGDLYRSAKTNSVTALRDYERREALLTVTGECVSKRENQHIEDLLPADVGIHWDGLPSYPDSTHWYRFAFGAIEDTALFVIEKHKSVIDLLQTPEQNATLLYSVFEDYQINKQMVAHILERNWRYARVDVDPHLKSLKAISTAAMMFRHFPYASVDVRILKRKIFNASWLRTCFSSLDLELPRNPWTLAPYALHAMPDHDSRLLPEALKPYALSEAQAFACLAMFESGQHDIDPGQLTDVMAMSSGNSIYVSAFLLADPYDNTQPGDIRGFIGNLGRPGISFLVPPKAPLTKEVSIDDWPFIERNEFDGRLSDHFQDTSLHLSFTTAELPLNIRFLGGQDFEACIVETLFSVYEGGRWIADLNVSNLQTSTRICRMARCVSQHPADIRPSSAITCIDSWLGLVDAPEERVSMVRAHGNWQARLAASSICIALGYDTIILPDDVCWKCFDGEASAYHGHVIAIG
ncbi:MAG: hypothetical protein Q9171_005223 [Xanthocarpia ochracea]